VGCRWIKRKTSANAMEHSVTIAVHVLMIANADAKIRRKNNSRLKDRRVGDFLVG